MEFQNCWFTLYHIILIVLYRKTRIYFPGHAHCLMETLEKSMTVSIWTSKLKFCLTTNDGNFHVIVSNSVSFYNAFHRNQSSKKPKIFNIIYKVYNWVLDVSVESSKAKPSESKMPRKWSKRSQLKWSAHKRTSQPWKLWSVN